jgi:hypothetical protein
MMERIRVMENDPIHKYLLFLYNYRFVFGIIIFVLTINAFATLLQSFRHIIAAINDSLSYANNYLFPKKKLSYDTLELVKEIELSVSVAIDKFHLTGRSAALERINPNSDYSNSVRASYKEKYLRRIESIIHRFAKYSIANNELYDLYKYPQLVDDQYRICVILKAFSSKLLGKQQKQSIQEDPRVE